MLALMLFPPQRLPAPGCGILIEKVYWTRQSQKRRRHLQNHLLPRALGYGTRSTNRPSIRQRRIVPSRSRISAFFVKQLSVAAVRPPAFVPQARDYGLAGRLPAPKFSTLICFSPKAHRPPRRLDRPCRSHPAAPFYFSLSPCFAYSLTTSICLSMTSPVKRSIAT
jgi:hypothetical protein